MTTSWMGDSCVPDRGPLARNSHVHSCVQWWRCAQSGFLLSFAQCRSYVRKRAPPLPTQGEGALRFSPASSPPISPLPPRGTSWYSEVFHEARRLSEWTSREKPASISYPFLPLGNHTESLQPLSKGPSRFKRRGPVNPHLMWVAGVVGMFATVAKTLPLAAACVREPLSSSSSSLCPAAGNSSFHPGPRGQGRGRSATERKGSESLLTIARALSTHWDASLLFKTIVVWVSHYSQPNLNHSN